MPPGDTSSSTNRWEGRPVLSWLLRASVFVIPILASIGTSLWLSKTLPTPTSPWHLIGWWVLILACSTGVLFAVDKLARKMLPLAALMQITMIFPDKAPKRFKTALKSGSSVKNLKEQLRRAESGELGDDLTEATEFILQLATALNTHDPRTRGHAERVRAYADMLAEELNIDVEDRAKLRWASLLHDIGKLKIDTNILNKPGKLDDDEWVAIKQHPVFGQEICEPLLEWLGPWGDTIVDHHERYDGNGYPVGKKGDEISYGGRIVNVADAYDVMTTVRSYKKPMTTAAAREELARHAGAQFDPDVVRAFLNISVGRLRWIAGPLSWLAQMPFLNFLGAVQQVGTAVGVAGLATAATAGIVGAGVLDIPDEPISPVPAAVIEAPPPQLAAVADTALVPEDGSTSISVLANDQVRDGVAVIITQDPAFGRVSVNADGTVRYVPNPDFAGSDSFGYALVLGDEVTASATVTVTVGEVNDLPTAGSDAATVSEDGSVVIDVLANDADPEGRLDPASLRLTVAPVNGTATVTGGRVTYTPAPDFAGTDAFTYVVSDRDGGSATAQVTITVTPVNDPPSVIADAATTPEDASTTVAVLTNDTDVDGFLDPSTLAVTTTPALGSAVPVSGAIVYTPDPDAFGTDSFSYRVCDDGGACGTALVRVTITAVNDAPVVPGPGPVVVDEEGTVTIDLMVGASDVEGDPLTLLAPVTSNADGSIVDNGDGTVDYTGPLDFFGTDTFTYGVSDGGAVTAVTVTISVSDVNDPPVVPGPNVVTDEDTMVSFDPVAGATDPDGDAVTLSSFDAVSAMGGTVASGSLEYTPPADFNGADTFNYVVTDGRGGFFTVTASVAVTPINDAPAAAPDSYAVVEDTVLTPPPPGVLANDSDIDGDPLTATVATGPAHGTVTMDSDGSFSYSPDANFNGDDSFTYTVSDGAGGWDTGTVGVIVTPANDPPVARNDAAATDQGVGFTRAAPGVLGNDYDIDGDSLAAALVVGPISGGSTTLVLNGDGSFSYTPDPSFIGVDEFVYSVTDGVAAPVAATVYITVDDGDVAVTHFLGVGTASPDTSLFTTTPPSAMPLPDYDGDGEPGRTVETGGGETSSDPVEYHQWALPSGASGIDVLGPATLNLWSTAADFDPTDDVHPEWWIHDCDAGGGSCTLLLEGDIHVDEWNGGLSTWVLRTIDLGHLDATVLPGRMLRVRLATIHNGLWLAYGTADYPSGVDFTFANRSPTANDDSDDIFEDGAAAIPAAANDADLNLDVDSITIATAPVGGVATPRTDGSGIIDYTPFGDWNGVDSFTYNICDTSGACSTTPATVTVTVTPLNDEPSFTDGGNVTVLEDSGNVSVPGWASVLDMGPSDEDASQSIDDFIIVSNDNPGLFAGLPDVKNSGELEFKPADDANGSAVIEVQMRDNGGVVNPGDDDTSIIHTFTITITAVNDEPSFTKGPNVRVDEDSGVYSAAGWATAMSPGPADESSQTLAFTVSADDTTLFSAQPAVDASGQLTFTPAPNANGSTSVDIYVTDSGAGAPPPNDNQSPPQSFTITIDPVNDEPSFTLGSDPTVNEDSGALTFVGWATAITAGPPDESGQGLTFTVSNDNNGLFAAQPDLDEATGNLTFTPGADQNGSATVSVYLTDSGSNVPPHDNQGATQSFTITVSPINDEPSFTKGPDVTVNEDSGAYSAPGWATALSAGPTNESSQTLAFAVTADNTALFSVQPAVDASGQLSFTPAPNANGSTTVDVFATDSGAAAPPPNDNQSASQSFEITVTPLNDSPVANDDSYPAVAEGGTFTTVNGVDDVDLNDTDAEDGTPTGDVTLVAGPSYHSGIFTLNADGTFTYTHDGSETTADSFTYRVKDSAGADSNVGTVSLTITPVNDPPVMSAVPDQADLVGAVISLPMSATDPDVPADTLSYSAVGLPDGLTISSAGLISGTIAPAAPTGSPFAVTVTVTDDGTPAMSDAESFTWWVGAPPAGVPATATGLQHTCKREPGGEVWCTGANARGQLGDNSTTATSTPVQVVGPGGVGFLSNVVDVGAGSEHSCAVRSDGTIWCWGRNGGGQLGDGGVATSLVPVQTSIVTSMIEVGGGDTFTCGLRSDGTVWCWGTNGLGQLGQGNVADSLVPLQVKGPGGVGFLTGVTTIGVGRDAVCATKADLTVWCWGENDFGQTGTGAVSIAELTPVQVIDPSDGSGFLNGVVIADVGDAHACARKVDGTAWCWGSNGKGQLGDGTGTDSLTPVQVVGVGGSGLLTGVSNMGTGHKQSCGQVGGGVVCWGDNGKGQLGDGTTTSSDFPVQVKGEGGIGNLSGVSNVFEGFGKEEHSCATRSVGTVFCWGQNTSGQLGDGTTTNTSTPVKML